MKLKHGEHGNTGMNLVRKICRTFPPSSLFSFIPVFPWFFAQLKTGLRQAPRRQLPQAVAVIHNHDHPIVAISLNLPRPRHRGWRMQPWLADWRD